MHIPLIQGRDISDSDGPDAQKVVIIDQFLTRKYFPRGDAIGACTHRACVNLPASATTRN
jgi:hypothetical protein